LIGDRRIRYREITIVLLYEGTNNDYETMKSVLLGKIDESIIKFSDLDFYYEVLYENSETEKYKNNLYRELKISLKSYSKFKDEITENINKITSKTINVPGNLETPVILEIIPSIDLVDLTINGLGEDITINNLTANKKIIIEDGLVLEEGINKFKDYDSWGFPKLHPGSNTITVDKNSCNITIKYKPRWI